MEKRPGGRMDKVPGAVGMPTGRFPLGFKYVFPLRGMEIWQRQLDGEGLGRG